MVHILPYSQWFVHGLLSSFLQRIIHFVAHCFSLSIDTAEKKFILIVIGESRPSRSIKDPIVDKTLLFLLLTPFYWGVLFLYKFHRCQFFKSIQALSFPLLEIFPYWAGLCRIEINWNSNREGSCLLHERFPWHLHKSL